MDTTPLLAAAGGLPGPNVLQDHVSAYNAYDGLILTMNMLQPAFLRASHSPWSFIPQNILVIFRGTILAYLIATAFLVGDYKLTEETENSKWSLFFDFAVISAVLVLLYHIITFSWTFTHLYYPSPEDNEGGIEGWIIKLMSLPNNLASLRKQFHFTMFYTTTVVFSFMNTVIYWFISRQHDLETGTTTPSPETPVGKKLLWDMSLPVSGTPFSDLFGEGWVKPFAIFNLYGISSVIMVIEILLLNSIKRPFAIGSHLFGLVAFSGLYLGWASIGRKLTGQFSFFWLDEKEVGSQEAVAVYCIGFVLLAPITYIFMQGFVGVRETLTRTRTVVQEAALES